MLFCSPLKSKLLYAETFYRKQSNLTYMKKSFTYNSQTARGFKSMDKGLKIESEIDYIALIHLLQSHSVSLQNCPGTTSKSGLFS